MANVGILTCASHAQELGCSGFLCYDAAYAKTGEFSGHEGDIRIKGVISCAGCPGKFGAERIVRRVNSLVASGVEILHFGNCMMMQCPFVAKYEKAIREAHPDLRIVHGVHPSPYSEEMLPAVGERVTRLFTEQRPTTPEISLEFRQPAGD